MYKQDYRVKIMGTMPLLMHQDDVQWADDMAAWKDDPANQKKSKNGDDRSPAWRWFGSLYHDGSRVVMPGDNIMRCLMEGGAMVPVPGGKNGKTFKSQSQSGMLVEPYWPLTLGDKEIPVEPFKGLIGTDDFARHQTVAARHGFMLFVKRARIGARKHIRVRPRFDGWSTSGTVTVVDEQITATVLGQILAAAGRYKGLGDWRPGCKTPGPFGMFTAEVRESA